jgi:hypothetical protein
MASREDIIPPPQSISGDNQFQGGGAQSYDFSDGGTYEDLYSQGNPYGSGYAQPAGQQRQQQQPNYDYNSTMPDFEEDRFPGQTDIESEFSGTAVGASGASMPITDDEKKAFRIWHIEYYSKYFDVDTTEVGARIIRSLVPFSYKFMDSVAQNPDLWGPFWIATTLIFAIAAASNFASWLDNKEAFSYDFETVSVGAGTIYGYVSLAPIILWAIFKWLEIPVTLLQNVCIYGYSLFVFLPVAGLCILPFEWLRWTLICSAAALSITFLLMNFSAPIAQNKYEGPRKPMIVAGLLTVIGLAHFGLALAFKLYFFNYVE